MSAWSHLKVVTRNDVDKRSNFSSEKFLDECAEDCNTEMYIHKDIYMNRTKKPIGFTFNIHIRDDLNSKSVKEFVAKFMKESPYDYVTVVDGVLTA